MMLIITEPQAGSTFGFYAHNFQKKFWKTTNKSLTVLYLQRFGNPESFRTFVR
jgi:hypothetical protein